MGSEKRLKLKECKWKGWIQQHLDEEQVIACNWEAFNLPAVSSSHRHSWNSSRHRQCIWIQTVWKSVLLKEKVKWQEIMCRHMFWVSMCLLFSEWNLAVTFLSSSAFLFLLRYLGPSSGDPMHLEFKSQLISSSDRHTDMQVFHPAHKPHLHPDRPPKVSSLPSKDGQSHTGTKRFLQESFFLLLDFNDGLEK